MNVTRKWNVAKYSFWDSASRKWQVPAGKDSNSKLTLLIKGSQFSLIKKRTAVESFSLVQNPKATHICVKGNNMAVITKCDKKFRKFKILFDSSKEAGEVSECLRKFVEIRGDRHSSGAREEHQIPNQNTFSQILERIMSSSQPQLPAPNSIPEDFPLESAVRLCLLDPGFPSLVQRVDAIVNNFK